MTPTDDQLRQMWLLSEDYSGGTTVGQRMWRAWDYVAQEIKGEGKKSWAIIKPDGAIVLDSEFETEAQAWQIALGWPSDEEIEQAKKDGYRAVLATVII